MASYASIFRVKITLWVICILLFLLPFLWLKPGELELGGDSSRLYLYDPGAFLRSTSLYSVQPGNNGVVAPNQNLIPYLFVLKIIDSIFHSPYLLINVSNALKLVGAFFFVYLIVVEMLKPHVDKSKESQADLAGILAGLFYTFSPSVGANMHAALLTHNQVFLNPVMFYLIMKFLFTDNAKYLWLTLLVTFLFSPNFTLIAPPPLFAFYPLALCFLALYVKFVIKKSLPWKYIFIGVILFLGIHAFHIIPVVSYTFDKSSYLGQRLLEATAAKNEGLNYFNAVLGLGKVSKNIFYTYSLPEVRWATLAVPLMIILGYLLSKRIGRDLALLTSFFFVTLFLTSANITQLGVEIYRKLFSIPGFGMFRVFYGQWQWVYAFFYSVLFGYLSFVVFAKLRLRSVYVLSVIIAGFFIYSSWTFISGDLLKAPLWGSNNMTNIMKINPDYEQSLAFLKAIPDDGKIINFPFTDYAYQLIAGTNNGAYIGVSPTAYLTGRHDYSGYQDIAPFSNLFLQLIKDKNYGAVRRLLGLLNVKYIFYSADPKAYKQFFPAFPYGLFLEAVPDDKALADLVGSIAGPKIFEQGYYRVLEADVKEYLPRFYIPATVYPFDTQEKKEPDYASFFTTPLSEPRVAFVERTVCDSVFTAQTCTQHAIETTGGLPVVTYKRINPTKYRVQVSGARNPYTLVFSDKYHSRWKLYISKKEGEELQVNGSYFDGSIRESAHDDIFLNAKTFETLGMPSIPDNQHFLVNGYANAWYITPEDSSGREQYEIIVEMVEQRVFYYSAAISIVAICVFLLYGASILRKK
ncbi:MAG: hypothetical protein AAB557_03295 [Patescibacteria group bacterium]